MSWDLQNTPRPKDSRRRIVDELIATGVPEVAAPGPGRLGRRLGASLYVIIPLVAIAILVSLRESPSSAEGPSGSSTGVGKGTSRGELAVSAQNIAFETNELALEAGARTTIHFENLDAPAIRHNIAIYQDAEADEPIFQGEIIAGGTDIDYEFKAPASGEYFFRCDVHPNMNGTVVVGS